MNVRVASLLGRLLDDLRQHPLAPNTAHGDENLGQDEQRVAATNAALMGCCRKIMRAPRGSNSATKVLLNQWAQHKPQHQGCYRKLKCDDNGAKDAKAHDATILDRRGRIYLALGRADEEFADLDKAITLGLTSPGPFYARGQNYEIRGHKEAAIADYQKTLELPLDDDAYHERFVQASARERLAALGVEVPAR